MSVTQLLDLAQLSGIVLVNPSAELLQEFCSRALSEAKCSDGITPHIFKYGIVPLLHFTKPLASAVQRSTAMSALVQLSRRPSRPSAIESTVTVNQSSAAARCAADPLCLIFSMLPVRDFFFAQRTCRNWRAARLRSDSWPCGSVELHAAMLTCEDETLQLRGVRELQRLLCSETERSGTIERIENMLGTLERLVHLLQSPNESLQIESVCALTNISTGTTQHVEAVVAAGAIPPLVKLLTTSDGDVKEHAILTLGNIACAGPSCRDLLLTTGVLPPLFDICVTNTEISLLRSATWLLAQLCASHPPPTVEQMQFTLPVLARLLSSIDKVVLKNAGCGLAYLARNDPQIQCIINTGVTQRLVELLVHSSKAVKKVALRTIADLVSGSNEQAQVVLNCNVLPYLCQLLTSENSSIRKDACFALSNFAGGTGEQVAAVFSANCVPPLIAILMNANERESVQNEAVWALWNLTNAGTEQHIRQMGELGAIPALNRMLRSTNSKITRIALEGLHNILRIGQADTERACSARNAFVFAVEECGALAHVRALILHQKHGVRLAAKRVARFFTGEDCKQELESESDEEMEEEGRE